MESVRPVRQNPSPQVNVLAGVRHRCHSPEATPGGRPRGGACEAVQRTIWPSAPEARSGVGGVGAGGPSDVGSIHDRL